MTPVPRVALPSLWLSLIIFSHFVHKQIHDVSHPIIWPCSYYDPQVDPDLKEGYQTFRDSPNVLE